MRLQNTPIVVDLWSLQKTQGATVYFLTHMHTDHTKGLSSKWPHPIYCSLVTRTLALAKFQLPKKNVIGLSLHEPHLIEIGPNESITVTLIDANHAPGAVMFLFQGYFGNILHTGDFRYTKEMFLRPPLSGPVPMPIECLYFDNTYCDPAITFPDRRTAMNMIIECIKSHSNKTKFVFGMRNLGKELMLKELAVLFRVKVVVGSFYMAHLKLLGMEDAFTTDCAAGWITAVPMVLLNASRIQALEQEGAMVIIPSAHPANVQKYNNFCNVKVIPYSDHSSYQELEEFIARVKPKQLRPIVHEAKLDLRPFNHLLSDSPRRRVRIPPNIYRQPQGTAVKAVTRTLLKKLTVLKQTPQGVVYDDSEEDETSPTSEKSVVSQPAALTGRASSSITQITSGPLVSSQSCFPVTTFTAVSRAFPTLFDSHSLQSPPIVTIQSSVTNVLASLPHMFTVPRVSCTLVRLPSVQPTIASWSTRPITSLISNATTIASWSTRPTTSLISNANASVSEQHFTAIQAGPRAVAVPLDVPAANTDERLAVQRSLNPCATDDEDDPHSPVIVIEPRSLPDSETEDSDIEVVSVKIGKTIIKNEDPVEQSQGHLEKIAASSSDANHLELEKPAATESEGLPSEEAASAAAQEFSLLSDLVIDWNGSLISQVTNGEPCQSLSNEVHSCPVVIPSRRRKATAAVQGVVRNTSRKKLKLSKSSTNLKKTLKHTVAHADVGTRHSQETQSEEGQTNSETANEVNETVLSQRLQYVPNQTKEQSNENPHCKPSSQSEVTSNACRSEDLCERNGEVSNKEYQSNTILHSYTHLSKGEKLSQSNDGEPKRLVPPVTEPVKERLIGLVSPMCMTVDKPGSVSQGKNSEELAESVSKSSGWSFEKTCNTDSLKDAPADKSLRGSMQYKITPVQNTEVEQGDRECAEICKESHLERVSEELTAVPVDCKGNFQAPNTLSNDALNTGLENCCYGNTSSIGSAKDISCEVVAEQAACGESKEESTVFKLILSRVQGAPSNWQPREMDEICSKSKAKMDETKRKSKVEVAKTRENFDEHQGATHEFCKVTTNICSSGNIPTCSPYQSMIKPCKVVLEDNYRHVRFGRSGTLQLLMNADGSVAGGLVERSSGKKRGRRALVETSVSKKRKRKVYQVADLTKTTTKKKRKKKSRQEKNRNLENASQSGERSDSRLEPVQSGRENAVPKKKKSKKKNKHKEKKSKKAMCDNSSSADAAEESRQVMSEHGRQSADAQLDPKAWYGNEIKKSKNKNAKHRHKKSHKRVCEVTEPREFGVSDGVTSLASQCENVATSTPGISMSHVSEHHDATIANYSSAQNSGLGSSSEVPGSCLVVDSSPANRSQTSDHLKPTEINSEFTTNSETLRTVATKRRSWSETVENSEMNVGLIIDTKNLSSVVVLGNEEVTNFSGSELVNRKKKKHKKKKKKKSKEKGPCESKEINILETLSNCSFNGACKADPDIIISDVSIPATPFPNVADLLESAKVQEDLEKPEETNSSGAPHFNSFLESMPAENEIFFEDGNFKKTPDVNIFSVTEAELNNFNVNFELKNSGTSVKDRPLGTRIHHSDAPSEQRRKKRKIEVSDTQETCDVTVMDSSRDKSTGFEEKPALKVLTQQMLQDKSKKNKKESFSSKIRKSVFDELALEDKLERKAGIQQEIQVKLEKKSCLKSSEAQWRKRLKEYHFIDLSMELSGMKWKMKNFKS